MLNEDKFNIFNFMNVKRIYKACLKDNLVPIVSTRADELDERYVKIYYIELKNSAGHSKDDAVLYEFGKV